MVEVHSLNIGGGKIMKTMTNDCHSKQSNSSSFPVYSSLHTQRTSKLAARGGNVFGCEMKGSKYVYCVGCFFLLRSSMVEVQL